MNRADLQKLSSLRIEEARVLLRDDYPAGAYYLAGYAVECALKACIARQTRQHDFPNKLLANRSHTHDLEALLGLSGLRPDFLEDMRANKKLHVNWTVVNDWSPDSRYDTETSRASANNLISACTARLNGVLPWIRKRW